MKSTSLRSTRQRARPNSSTSKPSSPRDHQTPCTSKCNAEISPTSWALNRHGTCVKNILWGRSLLSCPQPQNKPSGNHARRHDGRRGSVFLNENAKGIATARSTPRGELRRRPLAVGAANLTPPGGRGVANGRSRGRRPVSGGIRRRAREPTVVMLRRPSSRRRAANL